MCECVCHTHVGQVEDKLARNHRLGRLYFSQKQYSRGVIGVHTFQFTQYYLLLLDQSEADNTDMSLLEIALLQYRFSGISYIFTRKS